MGVVFNNTVVPQMGWDAMFILLGCFTLLSFIMLLFFKPIRGHYLPFADEDEEGREESMANGMNYFDKNEQKE